MMLRAPLRLFVLFFIPSLAFADNAPRVIPGEAEAWRFPAGYEPRPLNYSGIYQMDAPRSPPMLPHIGHTLSWSALNPSEGVYDFSYVERELAAAERGGYKIVFRLKASVAHADPPEVGQDGLSARMIPSWVIEKHQLSPQHLFVTSDPSIPGVDRYKQYASPWHPGVQAEFRRFITEFARRGILESNQCAAVYLHGISISSGEEMDLRYPQIAANANAAALAAGYTGEKHGNPLADAIMDCWPARMRWWAEFAGDRIYKIAFVGAGNMPGFPYPQSGLVETAQRLGLGQRYGNIEEYYYGNVIPPKHGQRYVSPGYVETDWTHPLRDGRYWGDENEEMNHYRMPDGSEPPDAVRALCYRSSFFRAAQLGMNFLWTNVHYIDAAGTADGRADENDFIAKWFTQVAGKKPELAPDAVAWLRLAWVRVLPGAKNTRDAQPWHNLEHLLMQRDVPASDSVTGAISQPALPMDFPYVALKRRDAPDGPPETSDNEYTARRTDLPANPHLAFKLDDAFRRSLHAQSQPIQIRVHFLHDNAASFTVRVAQPKPPYFRDLGEIPATEPDGQWKTAIFDLPADALPSPNPHSGLGDEIDFVVRALGPDSSANLTVRYVRVNRTAEIAAAPFIRGAPRDKHAALGETVRFSVHAEGPGELRYRWFKDNHPLENETKPELTLHNIAAHDAGTYFVEVSNEVRGIRTVRSRPATLQVTPSRDGNGRANRPR